MLLYTISCISFCSGSLPKSGVKYVKSKDVTEDMVPPDIETDRILAKVTSLNLSNKETFMVFMHLAFQKV